MSRLRRGLVMQAIRVGKEWTGALWRERASSMIFKSSRNRLMFCFVRWSLLAKHSVSRH